MGGITTTLFQRPRDPQFNNTTLLLSGNFPTNGAQNNTFLDSSNNGFSITRNGNTTQGSFSPFSQAAGYWSNYFDGNGDNLSNNGASGQFAFGTGAFTIEFWMYALSATNRQGLYSNNTSSMGSAFVFAIAGTNPGRLDIGNVGSSSVQTANDAFFANRWHHVALVREGTGANQTKIYVDGVEKASGTYSDNISVSREAQIGSTISFGEWFNGYLSNVRIVKGRAVYTSAFTPSTTPLSATTGGQNPPTGTQTSLLTAQSNRFVDNSGNDYAITRGGDTSVQAFSPFVPSGAYTTTAVGGSGYFDGTTDYLTYTTPSTVVREWWVNDFTVEAWIYPTTLTGWDYLDGANRISTVIGNASPTATNNFWSFGPINTGAVRLYYFNGAGVLVTSTETVKVNQWNHIAFTKTSTGIQIFVNGVGTTATAVSGTPQSGNTFPLTVGQINNTACNGYISGVRILNGTAQYSGTSYTIPTAPPTAITNTSFLLNFTNAGIFDSTAKNVLETVGSAQISTTQSKFGGSSMSFDGTGDWLTTPITQNTIIPASSSFTIEGWFRFNSAPASLLMILSDSGGNSSKYFTINGSRIDAQFGTSAGTTAYCSYTFSANTWYHIALVRNGTTVNIYVDGVSQAMTQGTQSGSFLDQGSLLYVGRFGGTPSYEFNGYIDDLRISKVARYTANFNVPTIGFTDR